MAAPVDREKLKADLTSSREATTAYVAALRHDLDLGARLKQGVLNNPLAWYAAAGLLGLLLSRVPPMGRKVVVKGPRLRADATEKTGKAAMAVAIAKFAIDFAKPALLRWLKNRLLKPAASPRNASV